jgi:hypothetical protein
MSELPGINKMNEEKINRIPRTNKMITILTERETSFFNAPNSRKTIPIKSNNK